MGYNRAMPRTYLPHPTSTSAGPLNGSPLDRDPDLGPSSNMTSPLTSQTEDMYMKLAERLDYAIEAMETAHRAVRAAECQAIDAASRQVSAYLHRVAKCGQEEAEWRREGALTCIALANRTSCARSVRAAAARIEFEAAKRELTRCPAELKVYWSEEILRLDALCAQLS